MREEFFIVMKVSCGNDALFWKPNEAGYTRFLELAGRYSREQAEEICGIRGEEFMVPCDVAEAHAMRTVDHSELMRCGERV